MTPTPYPLCWPEGLARTNWRERKPSPFRVQFAKARDEAMREFRLFNADDVLISSDMQAFSTTEPDDPGIALWFRWKGSWRCIACDTYSSLTANLRAVGLTVESLRTMERYGTQMLDQLMTGVAVQALPAPGPKAWYVVLGVPESAPLNAIETVFRQLAAMHHPDTPGGSTERMAEINAAIAEARRLKGGSANA